TSLACSTGWACLTFCYRSSTPGLGRADGSWPVGRATRSKGRLRRFRSRVPPDPILESAQAGDSNRDDVTFSECEVGRRNDPRPGEEDASRFEALVATKVVKQLGDRAPDR